MRGQSGFGLAKKQRVAKKVAKDLDKTEKLVLIQTGRGKSSHAFDPSYGQTNLVHLASTKAKKQTPAQKAQPPRIFRMKTAVSKPSNTIPSKKLVSTYL